MKKQHEQVILGIDPGTRVTGYGLIRVGQNRELRAIDFGCIRPPAKAPLSQKYKIIFKGLVALLEKYEVDALSIETQFIKLNPQTGIKLGMARAAAMLPATLKEIPVFEYPPARAKSAIVGNGRASKEQVQAMVKQLLGLAVLPEPEDAADALALAICHAHTGGQREKYQF